jgi:DNA polymerase III sliding clamp (beta) subunit (PCNA family)
LAGASGSYRERSAYPLLSAIAAAVWSRDSQSARAQLFAEALRTLPDPTVLLISKERDCAHVCSIPPSDFRAVHAGISADDFRAGRTVDLGGVRFSEMDVAVLLAVQPDP